ncbi:ATP-dependent zinc protease domain protein, partial [Chlamydia psittaci 84-8471/1]
KWMRKNEKQQPIMNQVMRLWGFVFNMPILWIK